MKNYVFLCHKKHAGFVLVTAVTFVIAFSRYNVRGRGDADCCIEQNTPVMEKLSPESLIDDIQRSFMGPLGAREKRFLGFLHCIHYNFSSARCIIDKSRHFLSAKVSWKALERIETFHSIYQEH